MTTTFELFPILLSEWLVPLMGSIFTNVVHIPSYTVPSLSAQDRGLSVVSATCARTAASFLQGYSLKTSLNNPISDRFGRRQAAQ